MNKKRFNKIVKDIKEIKIQGATNVAIQGLKAYSLNPVVKSKKKLISLRPTEPLLFNVLKKADKIPNEEILNHLTLTQDKINKQILKIIKNNDVVFTHCHSTSVVNALIYAKKKKKKFSVLNTETRPLYQGRKTARELGKNKIKVTTYVDSGMHEAIKKSDKIFIGADALLKKGIVNKIGSAVVGEIAKKHKKPVYILADSWKYYPKNIKVEERDFKEVWKKLPKGVKIKNPAFEFLPKKYITKIISDLGVLSYDKFLKKVGKK